MDINLDYIYLEEIKNNSKSQSYSNTKRNNTRRNNLNSAKTFIITIYNLRIKK